MTLRVDKIGVHATHCCPTHGCKYGRDDKCPVALAQISPSYPGNNGCERCEDDENTVKSQRIVAVRDRHEPDAGAYYRIVVFEDEVPALVRLIESRGLIADVTTPNTRAQAEKWLRQL